MDEFEALKQWAAKGYDVALHYGAGFDPPDRLKFEWTCVISARSIGSVHFIPIPRATGVHPIDSVEAIRMALTQAQTEFGT